MTLPLRAADLVLDQLVAGRGSLRCCLPGVGVRNAQKRLGEAHQDHALFAGQLILVEKRADTAGAHIARAHRDNQVLRQRLNAGRLVLRQLRLRQAGSNTGFLVHPVSCRDRGAARAGNRKRLSKQHESTLYASRSETSPQAGITVRGFIRHPERPCAA